MTGVIGRVAQSARATGINDLAVGRLATRDRPSSSSSTPLRRRMEYTGSFDCLLAGSGKLRQVWPGIYRLNSQLVSSLFLKVGHVISNPNPHLMRVNRPDQHNQQSMRVNWFNPIQLVEFGSNPIHIKYYSYIWVKLQANKSPIQAWLIPYKIDYSKYQNIKPPIFLNGFGYAGQPRPTPFK